MGGIRKSIHQSSLAKELGLGLPCWGFQGVQEEIPSEEASTLQIGSVAFPPEQCTSPQLHPCHRLFEQYILCIYIINIINCTTTTTTTINIISSNSNTATVFGKGLGD